MHAFFLLLQQLSRGFSAYFTDFTLQLTDTGFTGIGNNDLLQGAVADGESVVFQTVLFQLLPNQVFLCDMEFFICRITGHFNRFHTIQKRPWDFRRGIGCGYK